MLALVLLVLALEFSLGQDCDFRPNGQTVYVGDITSAAQLGRAQFCVTIIGSILLTPLVDEDLDHLSNFFLQNITGAIIIAAEETYEPDGTRFPGLLSVELPALRFVSDITIEGAPLLRSVNFAALTKCHSFRITENSLNRTGALDLSSLQSVEGVFSIGLGYDLTLFGAKFPDPPVQTWTARLSSLDLPRLVSAGAFGVYSPILVTLHLPRFTAAQYLVVGSQSLTSLVWPKLTHVTAAFFISALRCNVTLSALAVLPFTEVVVDTFLAPELLVAGRLDISGINSPELSFPALTQAAGISISECAELLRISMPNMRTLSGSLEIFNNNNLVSLDLGVGTVTSNLLITGNRALTDVSSLLRFQVHGTWTLKDNGPVVCPGYRAYLEFATRTSEFSCLDNVTAYHAIPTYALAEGGSQVEIWIRGAVQEPRVKLKFFSLDLSPFAPVIVAVQECTVVDDGNFTRIMCLAPPAPEGSLLYMNLSVMGARPDICVNGTLRYLNWSSFSGIPDAPSPVLPPHLSAAALPGLSDREPSLVDSYVRSGFAWTIFVAGSAVILTLFIFSCFRHGKRNRCMRHCDLLGTERFLGTERHGQSLSFIEERADGNGCWTKLLAKLRRFRLKLRSLIVTPNELGEPLLRRGVGVALSPRVLDAKAYYMVKIQTAAGGILTLLVAVCVVAVCIAYVTMVLANPTVTDVSTQPLAETMERPTATITVEIKMLGFNGPCVDDANFATCAPSIVFESAGFEGNGGTVKCTEEGDITIAPSHCVVTWTCVACAVPLGAASLNLRSTALNTFARDFDFSISTDSSSMPSRAWGRVTSLADSVFRSSEDEQTVVQVAINVAKWVDNNNKRPDAQLGMYVKNLGRKLGRQVTHQNFGQGAGTGLKMEIASDQSLIVITTSARYPALVICGAFLSFLGVVNVARCLLLCFKIFPTTCCGYNRALRGEDNDHDSAAEHLGEIPMDDLSSRRRANSHARSNGNNHHAEEKTYAPEEAGASGSVSSASGFASPSQPVLVVVAGSVPPAQI